MYKYPLGFKVKALTNLVTNRVSKPPPRNHARSSPAACKRALRLLQTTGRSRSRPSRRSATSWGVVERFKPWAVTILRRRALHAPRTPSRSSAPVKGAPGWRYVSIITNGWFLTDEPLRQAPQDRQSTRSNISLNYPDDRQDEDRKIKGLFKRISHVVPMLTAKGANVQMNSIIMNDNLDGRGAIAKLAHTWARRSCYAV